MKQLNLAACLLLLAACAVEEQASSGAAPTGGRSAPEHAGPSGPLGDKSGRVADDLTQFVEYYDGEQTRKAWISNEVVVELAPSEDGRRAVLGADSAAAEIAQPQKAVRVWRVRASQGADGVARALTRDALRFSPAFHETASSTSPLCALPGGAVATFQPDWDRARIDAWLAARQLAIVEPVVAEANMFLIATPPGLESIEIANRLHETGELVGCTPNVWRQAETR